MPAVSCPRCGTVARVDDRDLGRPAWCERCHAEFDPRPAEGRGRRDDDDFPRRPANDGGGLAVASALLGASAIVTSVCCGAGAVLGLGGLLTGIGGLRSRLRGWGVLGLVLSLAGLVLSLGLIVNMVGTELAQKQGAAVRPDGTKPPFADQFPTK